MANAERRKEDFRWIEKDRLGLHVHGNGVVTIHQRDHISRDKWETLIVGADDIRAMARALEAELVK